MDSSEEIKYIIIEMYNVTLRQDVYMVFRLRLNELSFRSAEIDASGILKGN